MNFCAMDYRKIDWFKTFFFNRFENSMSSLLGTGKSLTEALIFALTNPQYDRLFIELRVHYMKIAS